MPRAYNPLKQGDENEAFEATVARNAMATDVLLELLCKHHPAYRPEKLRQKSAEALPKEVLGKRAFEKPAVIVRTTGPVPFSNDNERAATIQEVQTAVCRAYGIERLELIGETRRHPVALIRQISFYLCREVTTKSFPEIARRHGDRDHTTVIHGARKIANEIKSDEELRSQVRLLKESLLDQAQFNRVREISDADKVT